MPILSIATAVSRFVRTHWVPLLVAAVVAAFAYLHLQVREAHAARVRAELALDSVAAVNDTTRLVTVVALWDSLRGVQDSVRVYERRAVQSEELSWLLADSLDRTVRALTNVTAQLDSVQATVTGTAVERPDSVPAAEFDLYQEPYRVWAEVVMYDPPIMRLDIRLDPIPMSIYVGCDADPAPGVVPAYADVSVPDYIRLAIGDVTFHPEVCNPGIFKAPSFWDAVPRGVKVGGTVAAVVGGGYGLYRLAKWLDLF